MSTPSAPATAPLHKNEQLKAESNFLRGHILRDLADHSTGGITEESAQLTKFHGIYAQDDRDQRNTRRREGREKAFSFMARVRVPGGVCTPAQWLALDTLADERANGTLKLTTRQAFQFHGILKGDLWRAINGMNRALLDTLAACGDVNRNVMCNPNPEQSGLHTEVYQVANAISAHLLPRSRAYHELWVGDELVGGGEPEAEPIYGHTYLPRKFKIGVAVPPSNDVDVFSQDLGYIAITGADGRLAGFNVTVGGGLGMSHNQLETFPRLADVLGFCTPEQAVAVAEHVVHGGRRLAEPVQQSVPGLVTVEDLHFDAEEIDRHVEFGGTGKADGILFRGQDEFHVAFDAALHEPVDFLAGKPVVVGEAAADFHPGAEIFQRALEVFRHGNATDGGDPFILEEFERLALAGEEVFEMDRAVGALDDLGRAVVAAQS